MVEVSRTTAVLDVDDSKLNTGLKAAEGKVRNYANTAGQSSALAGDMGGAVAGVTIAVVNAAIQAAEAIGLSAAMSWEKGMDSAIKTIGIDKFSPDTRKLSATCKTLNISMTEKSWLHNTAVKFVELAA
jgi:hypothetical protein